MGFYFVYQLARGAAGRDVAERSTAAQWILRFRARFMGRLFQAAFQRVVGVVACSRPDVVDLLALAVRSRRNHAALGLLLHYERFAGFHQFPDRGEPVGLRLTCSCRRRFRACSRSGASSIRWRSTHP